MDETVERGAAERSARGSTNTSYCEDEHTDHSERDHDDDEVRHQKFVQHCYYTKLNLAFTIGFLLLFM